MADENTNVTNNEELDPVVNNEDPVEEPKQEEQPVVKEEEEDNKDNKEITPEQKAQAAYIALRFLGVTPPSL